MPYNNGYYGQKPPKQPKDRSKLGLIFLIIGISCLLVGITMFIVVKKRIDAVPSGQAEAAYYGALYSRAFSLIRMAASAL